jgi:predicted Holliday junction resolvase-like endonuclease
MFTLVLLTVVAIVAIIGSIKMYNQIKNIQIDISAIKKDNERRIEYNRQRNEKRKEFKTNKTDIDKTLRRAEVMSKLQSVDKRG